MAIPCRTQATLSRACKSRDTSTFKRFVARGDTPARPAAVCRRGRCPHLAVLDMPILLLQGNRSDLVRERHNVTGRWPGRFRVERRPAGAQRRGIFRAVANGRGTHGLRKGRERVAHLGPEPGAESGDGAPAGCRRAVRCRGGASPVGAGGVSGGRACGGQGLQRGVDGGIAGAELRLTHVKELEILLEDKEVFRAVVARPISSAVAFTVRVAVLGEDMWVALARHEGAQDRASATTPV